MPRDEFDLKVAEVELGSDTRHDVGEPCRRFGPEGPHAD
jgi:hypothetical protein